MKRDISKKSTHISKKEYLFFFFRSWFPLIYGSFAQLFLMKSIKLRNYDKILSNLSHFKKNIALPCYPFFVLLYSVYAINKFRRPAGIPSLNIYHFIYIL